MPMTTIRTSVLERFLHYVTFDTQSDELSPSLRVPLEAGQCATCIHGRAVQTRRGSVFVLCQRAATDPTYTRYPRLPVIGVVRVGRLFPPFAKNQSHRIGSALSAVKYGPGPALTLGP